MKSGDTITAYAIATGKPLEGLTEEQKKAEFCADYIPKNPDETKRDITKDAACLDADGKNPYLKTISAENPKHDLGAPRTTRAAGWRGA